MRPAKAFACLISVNVNHTNLGNIVRSVIVIVCQIKYVRQIMDCGFAKVFVLNNHVMEYV